MAAGADGSRGHSDVEGGIRRRSRKSTRSSLALEEQRGEAPLSPVDVDVAGTPERSSRRHRSNKTPSSDASGGNVRSPESEGSQTGTSSRPSERDLARRAHRASVSEGTHSIHEGSRGCSRLSQGEAAMLKIMAEVEKTSRRGKGRGSGGSSRENESSTTATVSDSSTPDGRPVDADRGKLEQAEEPSAPWDVEEREQCLQGLHKSSRSDASSQAEPARSDVLQGAPAEPVVACWDDADEAATRSRSSFPASGGSRRSRRRSDPREREGCLADPEREGGPADLEREEDARQRRAGVPAAASADGAACVDDVGVEDSVSARAQYTGSRARPAQAQDAAPRHAGRLCAAALVCHNVECSEGGSNTSLRFSERRARPRDDAPGADAPGASRTNSDHSAGRAGPVRAAGDGAERSRVSRAGLAPSGSAEPSPAATSCGNSVQASEHSAGLAGAACERAPESEADTEVLSDGGETWSKKVPRRSGSRASAPGEGIRTRSRRSCSSQPLPVAAAVAAASPVAAPGSGAAESLQVDDATQRAAADLRGEDHSEVETEILSDDGRSWRKVRSGHRGSRASGHGGGGAVLRGVPEEEVVSQSASGLRPSLRGDQPRCGGTFGDPADDAQEELGRARLTGCSVAFQKEAEQDESEEESVVSEGGSCLSGAAGRRLQDPEVDEDDSRCHRGSLYPAEAVQSLQRASMAAKCGVKSLRLSLDDEKAVRAFIWAFPGEGGAYVRKIEFHNAPAGHGVQVGDRLIHINRRNVEGLQQGEIKAIWKAAQQEDTCYLDLEFATHEEPAL